MRKLLFLVASVVLASSSSVGCTIAEGSEDEAFDRDWVDDFENDDEEAAAEASETEELDEVDDLDDVEEPGGTSIDPESEATADPEGGPGPGEEPPLEGVFEGEGEGEFLPEGESGLPESPSSGPKATSSSRKRKHGPISIIEDDPNFSGSAGYDGEGKKIYDKAKSDDRLDRAKALGADAIRIMLWWKDKVPGGAERTTKPEGFVSSKPDQYDWRELDMQVEGARARGMKVLITIPAGPMPYWASEEPEYCVKQGGWSCAWKPKYKEYAKWVTAVGRHIKEKGYRIWGVTFVNEPNIGAFLKDESSIALAHRYRKLWFHARKAFRKTAGIKTRVLFSDQANNQKDLSPAAERWRLFNMALCLDLGRDAELIKGFCPEKKRRVEAHGIAFHPYAATPMNAKKTVDFLQKLTDEAAREGRLPKNRGLYMTESAFLTARGADATKLGAALSVTPNQQAIYMNKAERMLSRNPRVKSLSQYELVDEGRGTWDCGLIFAAGEVHTKGGEKVVGDFVELKIGRHVTVRAADGSERTIAWADIAENADGAKVIGVHGPGSPKPAYDAYRIGIDVLKKPDNKVEIWGLARPDTGNGFVIEGQLGDGSWHELKAVKTDALGYGRAVIPRGTAVAFRIRYGLETSRVAR